MEIWLVRFDLTVVIVQPPNDQCLWCLFYIVRSEVYFLICLFNFRIRHRNWCSKNYSFELFLLEITSTTRKIDYYLKGAHCLPPFLGFFLLCILKHHRINRSFWHFENSSSYQFHPAICRKPSTFQFQWVSFETCLKIICLKPLIWKNGKGKEKWIDF